MRMAAARIRWDRVGRWALICVFLLIVYLYVGPSRSWLATHAEAKRQRAQVAQLRTENARLRAAKRNLQGAAALERQARELGMVKAGERAYVVEGLPR